MEEQDHFKLVRLGLAKPSNLHPSHMIKVLADRLGVEALSHINREFNSIAYTLANLHRKDNFGEPTND
jgi:hypothetical protein